MFNDFKLLNYSSTKNKIRKIKEILDRLTLENLELELQYNFLLSSIEQLDKRKDGFVPFYPDKKPGGEEGEGEEEPIPPEEQNLPDLIISQISPTLFTNYVNYAITIRNQGAIASSITTLDAIIPGLLNQNTLIQIIEPGAEYTINVQYSFDPDGDEIPKTFISTVNPTHNFNESNFNNNSNSTQATVKEAYTEPEPGDPPNSSYVIFHLHNPEGKEINSIDGIVGSNKATITISGEGTFFGAANLGEHGTRHLLNTSGTKSVSAHFNGINITQSIAFIPNTTTEIRITFPRTTANVNYSFIDSVLISGNWDLHRNFSGDGPDNITIDDNNEDIFRTKTKLIALLPNQSPFFPRNTTGNVSAILSWELTEDKFETTASYQINATGHLYDLSIFLQLDQLSPFTLPWKNFSGLNSNPSIINWFSQYFVNSETQFFNIYIKDASLNIVSNLFNYNNPQGIRMTLIPASLNFTQIQIGDGGGAIGFGSQIEHNIDGSRNWNYDEALVHNNIHFISSVPYDLLGTAV